MPSFSLANISRVPSVFQILIRSVSVLYYSCKLRIIVRSIWTASYFLSTVLPTFRLPPYILSLHAPSKRNLGLFRRGQRETKPHDQHWPLWKFRHLFCCQSLRIKEMHCSAPCRSVYSGTSLRFEPAKFHRMRKLFCSFPSLVCQQIILGIHAFFFL